MGRAALFSAAFCSIQGLCYQAGRLRGSERSTECVINDTEIKDEAGNVQNDGL